MRCRHSSTAASSADDPSWITALVRWFLGQTSTDLAAIATLLEALPADRREPLSLEVATKAPLTSVDRWTVLTSFDRPWSSAFSAEAMKILSTDVSKDGEGCLASVSSD